MKRVALKRGKPLRRRTPLRTVGKRTALDRGELANARLELVGRSEGRCEAGVSPDCRGFGEHQHHVRRRAQGGDNHPANLRWVCGGPGGCHEWIHNHPAESYELGLLKRGTA